MYFACIISRSSNDGLKFKRDLNRPTKLDMTRNLSKLENSISVYNSSIHMSYLSITIQRGATQDVSIGVYRQGVLERRYLLALLAFCLTLTVVLSALT